MLQIIFWQIQLKKYYQVVATLYMLIIILLVGHLFQTCLKKNPVSKTQVLKREF